MMRLRLSKLACNDKGATAVEFAIILPVLLLFVFGIIEWGLYMYNRQVITNAAREGARHGVLMRMFPRNANDTTENDPEDPSIKAKVLQFAGNRLVTFGDDGLETDDVILTRSGVDDDGNEISLSDVDGGYPPENWYLFGENLTVEFDYEYDFLFLKIPPLNLGPLTITGTSTMRME